MEYKQEIVKSKDIAKSIASFANSEGGWYIVGIKEKENTSTAESIDIDLKTSKKPDNTINTAKPCRNPHLKYLNCSVDVV